MTALAALLEEAQAAPAARRIEFRDPIAAHGLEAVEALKPWLADDTLGAFAVRVIGRIAAVAGDAAAAAAAARVLRAARRRTSPVIAGDIDWELAQIRAARLDQGRTAAAPVERAAPAPAVVRRAALRAGEAPRPRNRARPSA